jgi:hypothetical protein
LQQLPIKRTVKKKVESFAKQNFQPFSCFEFERKALQVARRRNAEDTAVKIPDFFFAIIDQFR